MLLSEHPRIGISRGDIAKGVRVFPVGNYLILFRTLADGVEVVRYGHGARQLPGLV
jgi:toxin ParE1/3/4